MSTRPEEYERWFGDELYIVDFSPQLRHRRAKIAELGTLIRTRTLGTGVVVNELYEMRNGELWYTSPLSNTAHPARFVRERTSRYVNKIS